MSAERATQQRPWPCRGAPRSAETRTGLGSTRVGLQQVVRSLMLLLPVVLGSAISPHRASLRAPSFSRLAHAGIRTNRVVDLRGRTFSLRDEFVLPADATLSIRAGTLVGDAHSLFKLPRNRAQLVMEDVEIHHLGSPRRALRRELGGAIFALGKSQVLLRNCTVSSEHGFGLWLVQKARVMLSGCLISQCGRSGAVCFGHSRLALHDTTIDSCRLHGVCTRGGTHVSLVNSVVSNAGVRGIYAYHNATLHLIRSRVEGTRDATAAAVQVEALRPEDRATLVMDAACRLRDNAGEDLRVSGTVDVTHRPRVQRGRDAHRSERGAAPTLHLRGARGRAAV